MAITHPKDSNQDPQTSDTLLLKITRGEDEIIPSFSLKNCEVDFHLTSSGRVGGNIRAEYFLHRNVNYFGSLQTLMASAPMCTGTIHSWQDTGDVDATYQLSDLSYKNSGIYADYSPGRAKQLFLFVELSFGSMTSI